MDIQQVLMTVWAVFIMLVILTVIIFVHELGHYSAARFFGFQTPVFGLGLPFFGPYWTMFKKWGTEFRFHALFIGGYVLIPELGDETAAVSETYGVEVKPFKKFPVWQRAIVAAAGVFNNVVFAYLLMIWLLMTFGSPIVEIVVAFLPNENPIAREAGIKVGDRILAIDDQPVESTDQVVTYLGERKNQKVVLHVFRPDKVKIKDADKAEDADKPADSDIQKKDTPATDTKSDAGPKAGEAGATEAATGTDTATATGTATDTAATTTTTTTDTTTATDSKPADPAKTAKQIEEEDTDTVFDEPGQKLAITMTTNAMGKVGMGLGDKMTTNFQKIDGNFFDIAGIAGQKCWTATTGMCKSLVMMVEGISHNLANKIAGPKAADTKGGKPPAAGIEDVHGLLFVLKIGSDIAQQDWRMLPMFTILISLDLAIINLLPWPGLDGGHLAFMGVEAVRGKPLHEKTQGELVKWGLMSLLVLMAIIMVNDIRSMVTGEAGFKVKSKSGQQQSAPANSPSTPSTQPTPTEQPVEPPAEQAKPEESTK